MQAKFMLFAIALNTLFVTTLLAEKTDTLPKSKITETELKAAYIAHLDSVEASINYQTGEVVLPGSFASVKIPKGFKYVDVKDTKTILFDVWGNVPYTDEVNALGMLVPENFGVNKDLTYAVEMTFVDDGFVKDDEAKNIDYDDLLKDMQASTEESNKELRKTGYSTAELIGWASAPYYDEENKKLQWAKELKFDGTTENTLNYAIRVLGRRGFIELTAISDMSALNDVNEGIPPLLASINFSEGHKYSDFNPNLDKVAAYGIGGLIAGKVLLKTGLLAKAGLILAKSWKIILIVFAGLGGAITKLFRRREKEAL